MTADEYEQYKQQIAECADARVLAQTLAIIRAKRDQLSKVTDRYKSLDDELRGRLVMLMDVSGQKSVNFEGIGTLSKTTRQRAEIRDFDKMSRFMAGELETATAQGRPPVDVLSLLQRRAALGTVKELQAAGVDLDAVGVALVDVTDISVKLEK